MSDPNDSPTPTTLTGDVLLRNVQELMMMLDSRVANGELGPEERDQALQREVKKMVRGVDVAKVNPKQAWQFGDAFRLAGDWQNATKLYETAVDVASSPDRRINDRLRLARAQAHLGRVDEALANAKATFDSDARDKAPILLGVLYEIVPEGLGKSRDLEFARLLEAAIGQHQATIVDPSSNAGGAFLAARPAHVRNAWIKIARIYQSLGKDAEARQAVMNAERDRKKTGNF